MFLSGLNKEQKQAVETTQGPVLILAGAGSGKTRVVTHKIAYLIKEKGIFPGNILAITFTNKAAQEMKDRTAKLLDIDVDPMWIGTFHSICVRILRRDIDKLGYERSFTIYDRQDQKTLIKECLSELELSQREYNDNTVLNRISELKDMQISPKEFLKASADNFREKQIALIYALYEEKLKEYNSLDFDDLLCKTVELLNQEEDILKYYQNRFEYVFVDEYQDTNKIQYELAKLMSGKHNNICVVGDIDQSIYGWRGADIRNIMDFEKDFKDAETILLEQNYRSTQKILDVANSVIKYNYNKEPKKLWSDMKDGADVEYYEFESAEQEAQFVTNEIDNLISNEGYKASDIAILYRANAQSRNFEDIFLSRGIPYKVVGGLKFYDRKEVKDIIAYIQILENPRDNISMKRIINTPKRGIGDATVKKLEDYGEENNMSIYETLFFIDNIDSLGTRARNKLKDFATILNLLIAKKELLKVRELIEETITLSGYQAALEEEDTVEARTRLDNISEFVTVASNFEEREEDPSLENFLSRIALLSDVDKTIDKDRLVTMMTIHSAKGLEFPVVFLVGMEEGQFPTGMSIDSGEEEIEEERRLCYVGVTRAEKRLYLTGAKVRMIFGRYTYNLPSRFLNEMGDTIKCMNCEKPKDPFVIRKEPKTFDEDIVNGFSIDNFKPKKIEKKNNSNESFKLGDKIKHKAWGEGMLVEVKDEDFLVVAFEGKGLKRLSASTAPIEKL